MKEKGSLRQTLEKVGKAWTVISVPVELFLLGHGIATGNKLEMFLGAGGLVGDIFLWKWFNRSKRNELKHTSLSQLSQVKGSQRFQLV